MLDRRGPGRPDGTGSTDDVVVDDIAITRAERDRVVEAEDEVDPTGSGTNWELDEYLGSTDQRAAPRRPPA